MRRCSAVAAVSSTTFVCAMMMAAFGGRVQPTAVVKHVNETETFYYEIRPEHFNWTNGIHIIIVFRRWRIRESSPGGEGERNDFSGRPKKKKVFIIIFDRIFFHPIRVWETPKFIAITLIGRKYSGEHEAIYPSPPLPPTDPSPVSVSRALIREEKKSYLSRCRRRFRLHAVPTQLSRLAALDSLQIQR